MNDSLWIWSIRIYMLVVLTLLIAGQYVLIHNLRRNGEKIEQNTEQLVSVAKGQTRLTEAMLSMAEKYAESSLKSWQHAHETLDDIKVVVKPSGVYPPINPNPEKA